MQLNISIRYNNKPIGGNDSMMSRTPEHKNIFNVLCVGASKAEVHRSTEDTGAC